MNGLLVIVSALGTLQSGGVGHVHDAARSVAGAVSVASFEIVDARTYRHCHNTPRRVYCHTREHLPVTLHKHATTRV